MYQPISSEGIGTTGSLRRRDIFTGGAGVSLKSRLLKGKLKISQT